MEEFTAAVIESGDEFLNCEAAPTWIPDAEGSDIDAFVGEETERFRIALAGYIRERIEAGEFVS